MENPLILFLTSFLYLTVSIYFVLIGRNERSEWRSYLTFLRHSSTIVMRGSDVRLRLHVAVDVGSTVLKVRFQEVLGIFELE